MKNLQTNRTDVNLPIEKIKEDFELLFISKLITNSTQELKAIKEITETLSTNSNSTETFKIESWKIKSIIDDLPFNSSGGQSGLTNQLLKISANEELLEILKLTLQEMIDINYFPDNFNIAQMYALVKDPS